MESTTKTQAITLGGGCFWCTEAVFERVEGVVAVESGYCNGHVVAPTYEQVCRGDTGHVEVIRVTFDPARIGLREILEIFFAVHDPTTADRQGNDVGPQYRSGIYLHDESQRATALQVRAEADAAHGGQVVTEVEALRNYSRAEDYHQHYYERNPRQGYCTWVVRPKVEKFERAFRMHLRRP
ncbi:MAG: peptide-methionine (S)-S-oxide reductase MsrA [Rubrivivax sp.]